MEYNYGMTKMGTRKLLADELKKLLHEKDISKISVSELTAGAGINRKTFYYHFRDVYELLAWIFETEAIGALTSFDLATDYRGAISFAMDYLEENEAIINRLARSRGLFEIRRFLHRDLYRAIEGSLDRLIPNNVKVDEDYKSFVAEFLTEAIAGVLLHWAEDPNLRDRKKIEAYLSRMIEETSRNLVEHFVAISRNGEGA